MKAFERFIKYASFNTTASEEASACPSSEGQRALGSLLVGELRALGLTDARIDENGYVYASLDAN